jgi:NAD(P)-dependent dehydrogenase (short-subunit alcohol dehydrogenase family)
MEIKGTVSVITGGASGLGAATARALVDKGGRVAILDMDEEKGRAMAHELGSGAAFFPLNVSDHIQVDAAVQAVKEKFKAIHVVVNCAGTGGSARIVGKDGVVPQEWFTRIVNINLVGTFNMIRSTVMTLMANAPNKEGERGVYVNTSSIAAQDGQIGQAAYSASKGGLVSMTLTLAREFARDGIRIMTILPGIFHTPLMLKNSQEVLDRLASQVPFPMRLGRPEEFAALTCHIVENPYLNGESIRLDGALRMGFGRK